MTHEVLTTKEAKDGPEFETYPTYSMAILWNADVELLNRLTVDGMDPLPVDGDAGPRTAYRALDVSSRWDLADAHLVSRLRMNHSEINRNNR